MALYAVAIVLPDEVEIELDHLRGEFSKQMVYISIPHITLAYPFVPDTHIKQINEELYRVAVRTRPFIISFKGFGYFQRDNNVAYVTPVNKQPIIDLHYDINRSINELVKDEYRGRFNRSHFVPHLTIGTEIPDDIFPKVKKRLSENNVHYESEITSFSLLCSGEDGVWKRENVFWFSR